MQNTLQCLSQKLVLENRVLLRSTQSRPAGLQDNRARLAAPRGKSKRFSSAPRHLRSALKSGCKSFSFSWMASERYVSKSWAMDTYIYFPGFGYKHLPVWIGNPVRHNDMYLHGLGSFRRASANATSRTHVLQETISKQGDSNISLF